MKRIIITSNVSDNRYLLMEVFSLVGGNWKQKEKHEANGTVVPPCWISLPNDTRYSWPDDEDPLVTIDTSRISIASYTIDIKGNIVPTHDKRTIMKYNQNDLDFLENMCNLNHAIAYSFKNYFTSLNRIKNYENGTVEYTTVPYIKHEFPQSKEAVED